MLPDDRHTKLPYGRNINRHCRPQYILGLFLVSPETWISEIMPKWITTFNISGPRSDRTYRRLNRLRARNLSCMYMQHVVPYSCWTTSIRCHGVTKLQINCTPGSSEQDQQQQALVINIRICTRIQAENKTTHERSGEWSELTCELEHTINTAQRWLHVSYTNAHTTIVSV